MDTPVRTVKTDKIFVPQTLTNNSIIDDYLVNVAIPKHNANNQTSTNLNIQDIYTSNIQNKRDVMIPMNSLSNSSQDASKKLYKEQQTPQIDNSNIPLISKYKDNINKKLLDIHPVRLGFRDEIPIEYNKKRLFLGSELSALIDNYKERSPNQEINNNLRSTENKLENGKNRGIVADDINKFKSRYIQPMFWIEDPSALFQTFDVIPDMNMTDAERLNAMTRVIIIITVIMFLFKFQAWWLFLCLGLIVVIIIWYIVKGREQIYNDRLRGMSREYLRRPRKSILTQISEIPEGYSGRALKGLTKICSNKIIKPINLQHDQNSYQGNNIRDINNQELKIVSLR